MIRLAFMRRVDALHAFRLREVDREGNPCYTDPAVEIRFVPRMRQRASIEREHVQQARSIRFTLITR